MTRANLDNFAGEDDDVLRDIDNLKLVLHDACLLLSPLRGAIIANMTHAPSPTLYLTTLNSVITSARFNYRFDHCNWAERFKNLHETPEKRKEAYSLSSEF